jgi:protein CpxP
MKRLTYSVVIAAVLGLAAYTIAGAQAPRRGAGPGPGFDGFGGRGPGGAGVMGLLRGLNLTDQQREQIRAIHEAERESRDVQPGAGQLHRQLLGEIFADAPDSQKLAEAQQQLLQAHANALAKQTAVSQQIAQMLTAEQRAAVRERLAAAPARAPGARRAPETPGLTPERESQN